MQDKLKETLDQVKQLSLAIDTIVKLKQAAEGGDVVVLIEECGKVYNNPALFGAIKKSWEEAQKLIKEIEEEETN